MMKGNEADGEGTLVAQANIVNETRLKCLMCRVGTADRAHKKKLPPKGSVAPHVGPKAVP